MIYGTDVSSAQGSINMGSYNRPFIIIKATEGTGYTNPYYGTQVSDARSKGIGIGSYHFARPDTGNSAIDEANHFTSVVGTPQDGEIVCLDFEVSYGSPQVWCKDFMDDVTAIYNGKVKPYIYLNQSLVSGHDWSASVSQGYHLWLARYFNDGDFSTGSGQWGSYSLKQYSDNDSVPGISGNVDGDSFNGDIAGFKATGYQSGGGGGGWSQNKIPPHTTGKRILDIRSFADYDAVGSSSVSHTEGLDVMPHEPYNSAPIYEARKNAL